MNQRMALNQNTRRIRGDRIIARRNPLLLGRKNLALVLGNSTSVILDLKPHNYCAFLYHVQGWQS